MTEYNCYNCEYFFKQSPKANGKAYCSYLNRTPKYPSVGCCNHKKKAADYIQEIALKALVDIQQGRAVVLPEGWSIEGINNPPGTVILGIPLAETKQKEEKEIPFSKWCYLLFKSILKDIHL